MNLNVLQLFYTNMCSVVFFNVLCVYLYLYVIVLQCLFTYSFQGALVDHCLVTPRFLLHTTVKTQVILYKENFISLTFATHIKLLNKKSEFI